MDGSGRRPHSSLFEVRIDGRDGVTLLALCGELDMATSPILDNAVANLELSAREAVLVDLGKLSFSDSMGVRALVFAISNLRIAAARVEVVGASDPVKKVFALLGLGGVLDGSAPLELLPRVANRQRAQQAQAVHAQRGAMNLVRS